MPSIRGLVLRVSTVLHLLLIFQLLSSAHVFAEWLLVDGNAKAKVYVDPESVTRKGDLVRVWVLDDLKTVHTRGFSKYLSIRAQEEHDCVKERFRLLALENFSGNMGAGDVIYKKSGESGWSPIPRGMLAQSVWKFVCGKK
jgi:hypothetical protein